jgi:hypothetical protein
MPSPTRPGRNIYERYHFAKEPEAEDRAEDQGFSITDNAILEIDSEVDKSTKTDNENGVTTFDSHHHGSRKM